jgi:hypothetical protein
MQCAASATVQHAVLDTDVLVSDLIRPDGSPRLVLPAVRRGELVPVFSAEILACAVAAGCAVITGSATDFPAMTGSRVMSESH